MDLDDSDTDDTTINFRGQNLNMRDHKAITENKEAVVAAASNGEISHTEQLISAFADMVWAGVNRQSDDNLLLSLLCAVGDKLLSISEWEIERDLLTFEYTNIKIPSTLNSLLTSCVEFGWVRSMRWLLDNRRVLGFDLNKFFVEAYGHHNSLYSLAVTILISGCVPMLDMMTSEGFVKDVNFLISVDSENMYIVDSILTTLIMAEYDLGCVTADYWIRDEDGLVTLRIEYEARAAGRNLFEAALVCRLTDTLELMDWPVVNNYMIALYTDSRVGKEKIHVSLQLQRKLVEHILCLPIPLEGRIVVAEAKLKGLIVRDRNIKDKILRV